MAESVHFNTAAGILNALNSIAGEELGLTPGVKDELTKLTVGVSLIQGFILDAEARCTENYEIKDWLQKLGDVLCDVDDLVDELATEALRLKVMSQNNNNNKVTKEVRHFFFKLSYCCKMYPRFKEVRETLDTIKQLREQLHLSCRSPPVNIQPALTYPFEEKERIFGRYEDKQTMIRLLLGSDVQENVSAVAENVSVIPIVGKVGLGKTTLTQLVYNDEQVQNYFQLKRCVCASQHHDLKGVVEQIIESGIQVRVEDSALETLLIGLGNVINAKRFLLILEDVQNENVDYKKWSLVKEVLDCGAKGSMIVITTRSHEVADNMGTFPSYVLEPLSNAASWDLFKEMAFKREEPTNHDLEEIGRDIVMKCEGVPLVIRSIGRLLYSRKSKMEWSKFRDDELPNILQIDDPISLMRRLTYDNFPSHLKSCFAYCAVFPRDHKIDVQTLIKLWMGQGFLMASDPGSCLENSGYLYFMDLISWSVFQEKEIDDWKNIRSCKMQNLMHDLAISAAGVVSTMLEPNSQPICRRTQHVSVNFSLHLSRGILISTSNSVRSFLLPSQSRPPFEEKFSKSSCNLNFSKLKLLRMLDLHDLGIKVVPTSLRELKHLRYLDLSKNGMKKLPSFITKLQNLQTLKLSNCDVLEELPKDVKNLIRLKHLEIDGCHKLARMPRGLGQLTDLRTLSLFVLRKDNCSVNRHGAKLSELKCLNNLSGELEILHLEHLADTTSETNNANLKEKQHLQFLTLRWYRQDYDDAIVYHDKKSLEGLQPHQNLKILWVTGYGGMEFPDWFSSLRCLVKFTLCNCPRLQCLPPLDQLESLKSLKLQSLHALEYIKDSCGEDEVSSTFFQSLEELVLWDCPKLQRWWRHDNNNSISFPCSLSKLEVQYCPELTSMPLYLHLDEQLVLINAKVELLQQTMRIAFSMPSSSSVSLCTLMSLTLSGIEKLESLQWLQNLPYLERLNIFECPRLTFLSAQDIQNLTSLEYMDIRDCEELDLSQHVGSCEHWKRLKKLRSLTIWGIPKLVALPKGLKHVKSLEKLRILNCPELIALPDWISNFISLDRLVISKCGKLKSLPKEISNLKLHRLVIDDCPTLMQRCRGETAEDFHKIQHIQDFSERPTSWDFE